MKIMNSGFPHTAETNPESHQPKEVNSKDLIKSMLLPFIKDGQKYLNVINFNPHANFLDSYLESVKGTKNPYPLKRKMKNRMIQFLKVETLYQEINGKPYYAFANVDKFFLGRMREFMYDKKLNVADVDVILDTLEITFNKAVEQGVITEWFNPFSMR